MYNIRIICCHLYYLPAGRQVRDYSNDCFKFSKIDRNDSNAEAILFTVAALFC